jgi:putative DNA methylase
MSGERRLIEEYLPVRAVSYEATREKLLRRRDYHISMLHLWWARRPLAAARAAVYSTLVTADARQAKDVAEFLTDLCRWGGTDGAPQEAVAKARAEIAAENPGPLKVLDCFAGGGAIPLEVGRLGGHATAVELNPVAYLVLLCTLVYPQTYGPSLADDVEEWGGWLVEEAKGALDGIYPPIALGIPSDAEQLALDTQEQLPLEGRALTPIAYLWTRTVPCPNPALDPHELHLVRQTWLVKKSGRTVALRPVVDRERLRIDYEVVEAPSSEELGFDPEEGSQRGAATCRVCGAGVTADDVKALGKQGKLGRQLMAMAAVRPGTRGKTYLGSREAAAFVPAEDVIRRQLDGLLEDTGLTIPETPLTLEDSRGIWAPLYGLTTVRALFTERQLLTLLTFCSLVREAYSQMVAAGMERERAKAVATYLGLVVDRVADRNSSLCHWDNSAEKTANTYARQALPMVWDYSEVNPFGGSSGDLASNVAHSAKVIRHCAATGEPATVIRGSATDPVPGGPFDAIVTDPPYYDNISYSDLSDFFYAWLQRSVGHLYPEHLSGPLTPKRKEIVAVPYRHEGDAAAASQAYDDMMAEVFARRREELKPEAPLVVVYAHKTYAGWATLVQALRRAGFVIVEAWPLDTEMPTRSVSQNTASLASSIFLVARRRETDGIGSWDAVNAEMRRIVRDRVRELPDMGVAGDDVVIAAIGAGLRAYTAYGRVELPNGEELPPEQFLEEVQRAVIDTVLEDIFSLEDSGIGSIDPTTQLYVMGRFEFGGAFVDFDRANTLAHGVGVELSGPRGALAGAKALFKKEKSKVRLRDFRERGSVDSLGLPAEGGEPAPLIDVLQHLLWVAENDSLQLRSVVQTIVSDSRRLRLVAQALSGEALERRGAGTSGREQQAIASLLTGWKRLVEDTLAGGRG